MKYSIVAAAVLSTVFMSAGVFAAEDYGVLTIKGAVVGNPCTFVNGSDEETVILKQISLSDINEGSALQPMSKNSEQTKVLAIKCPMVKDNEHIKIRIIAPNMEDSGFISNQNATGPKNAGFMLTSPKDPNKVINNLVNTITVSGTDLTADKEYTIPLTVHYSRKAKEEQQGDLMATVKLEVSAD